MCAVLPAGIVLVMIDVSYYYVVCLSSFSLPQLVVMLMHS